LAKQLLIEDLVDAMHIFRSAKPAGGDAVMLDTSRFEQRDVPNSGFDGFAWEVWERAQGLA
jgi:riboflavin biosynthesis pyrimidine reductase